MPRFKSKDKDKDAVPADIIDLTADSKLAELQQELADAQTALISAQARLEEAAVVLTTAKVQQDRAESRHLAGRITDEELASARAAAESAKREQALAQAALEDNERLVRILPDAIQERRQAALTAIRDNLRTAYAAKLAHLAAVVRQAQALNLELDDLHLQARSQLGVCNLMKLDGALLSALDLGEAGGFVMDAGGMPQLASPWLTNLAAGRNHPSMADNWLKAVDAYVAVSPAERAERDRQHRESALANAARRKAEASANEKARAELRQKVADRFAISPNEVMF
jgi:hypothetical protein